MHLTLTVKKASEIASKLILNTSKNQSTKTKKKEKKKEFGKPLSKQWWGNIWYYHKGAILICSVFAILIVVTTMMLPDRNNLDMSFLYIGNYKFNDAQRISIEEELKDYAVDWNGDGIKKITFATAEANPFLDDDWNQEYTKLIEQLLDSSITDLYLMDENCLKYFKMCIRDRVPTVRIRISLILSITIKN